MSTRLKVVTALSLVVVMITGALSTCMQLAARMPQKMIRKPR